MSEEKRQLLGIGDLRQLHCHLILKVWGIVSGLGSRSGMTSLSGPPQQPLKWVYVGSMSGAFVGFLTLYRLLGGPRYGLEFRAYRL